MVIESEEGRGAEGRRLEGGVDAGGKREDQ